MRLALGKLFLGRQGTRGTSGGRCADGGREAAAGAGVTQGDGEGRWVWGHGCLVVGWTVLVLRRAQPAAGEAGRQAAGHTCGASGNSPGWTPQHWIWGVFQPEERLAHRVRQVKRAKKRREKPQLLCQGPQKTHI